MARASSLLLLSLFSVVAYGHYGQGFGRFGYSAAGTVPGFKISQRGFQANVPVSDEFVFPTPTATWNPTKTSAQSQIIELGAAADGGPTLLKLDLSVPGFSLYFPKGIELQVGTISAPFLTWVNGSVDQTVSTPPVSWILVSFRQAQPPILLTFVDQPQAMIVDGVPGKWRLRTMESFSGWVRITLPLGLSAKGGSTASALGEMVQKINANLEAWSGAEPRLIDTKVTSDASSVTATWIYDKAGALVPQAALLSGFGGYPINVTTKIDQLESSSEEGPMAVTTERDLSIRFPIRPWPECRYLATGDVSIPSGGLGVDSAVNLAFSCLSGGFTPQMNASAGASLMAFLSSAKGDVEPVTGGRYPYATTGTGYDSAAAHALLTQALAVSNGTPSLQNPLLNQVSARVDFYTWRPWAMDERVWRRALALSALSHAMRPEPEQRLMAAMAQAGLSAQRGLDLWRYWRGDLTKLPQRLEVLEPLRRNVFSLQGVAANDAVVDEVFSPLRLCGPGQLQVVEKEDKWLLRWMAIDAAPASFTLFCPGLKLGGNQNLQSMQVLQNGAHFTIQYTPTAAGICALEVILPDGSRPIPTQISNAYVEVLR